VRFAQRGPVICSQPEPLFSNSYLRHANSEDGRPNAATLGLDGGHNGRLRSQWIEPRPRLQETAKPCGLPACSQSCAVRGYRN
jgi:hypothetical protein